MKIGNSRGAVSVFLVIILVPCLAITSVFVETGRVNLSKSLADSSADLALNSLLTNYDGDLMEWYGLMASCQDVNEFYKTTKTTFARALKSANLSEDEMMTVSAQIASMFKNEQVSDLLKIECDPDSVSVKAVDNTSLENPAMMRDKIVEFMKYRGPIELTTRLIDRLKTDGLGTQIESITQSKENNDIIEAKKQYYTAESGLMSDLLIKYRTLMQYHETLLLYHSNIKAKDDLIASYCKEMETYISVYEQIIEISVKNLLNTSKLSEYHRIITTINDDNLKNNNIYKDYFTGSKNIYSSKSVEKVDGKEVTHYYISNERIKEIITDLENKTKAVELAIQEYQDAAKPFMDNLPGDSDSSPYIIQWWYGLDKAVNSPNGKTAKLKKCVDELVNVYAKALALKAKDQSKKYIYEFDDTVSFEWNKKEDATVAKYDTLMSEAKKLINKNFISNSVIEGSSLYLQTARKLKEVSSSKTNNNLINVDHHKVTFNNKKLKINDALGEISKQLDEKYKEITKYISCITQAIDGNMVEKSLDSIETEIKGLIEKLGEWEEVADTHKVKPNGTKNPVATSDLDEIKGIRTNEDKTGGVSVEDVKELKKRLENMKTVLQAYKQLIDDFKFGDTKIMEIKDFSTFKTKLSIKEADVKYTNGELKKQIDTSKKSKIQKKISDLKVENSSDKAYHLLINPDEKEVDTPKMFVKLYERFKSNKINPEKTPEQAQEEAKGDQEKANNKETEQKDNATKGKYKYNDLEGLINTEKLGDGVSLLDSVTNLGDFLSKLIHGEFQSMIDDLYSTEYVMTMFSFATLEYEGCYKLIKEKDNSKALSLSASSVESLVTGNYSSIYKNEWKSEALKDTYNKTLTNKLFSLTNNRSFCAEVEYILKGKKENEENVKAVYTDIYVIRYAINLISGMLNFYSGNNTTANAIRTVATSIQGATFGIIPAPLTKVLMIALLTAFETASDTKRLSAGFPVEIYKSSHEDWVCTLDGVFESIMSVFDGEGLTQKSKYNNNGKGLYYSDYLTIFVYLGFQDSKTSSDMYKRIAKLISTNIGSLRNEADYSLSKSFVYFNLQASVVVDPLLFNMNIYNGYNEGIVDKKGWRTYNVNITRGYS